MIFRTWINPPVQNKINRISVLIKKEERLPEGNKKKVKAHVFAKDILLNKTREEIARDYVSKRELEQDLNSGNRSDVESEVDNEIYSESEDSTNLKS